MQHINRGSYKFSNKMRDVKNESSVSSSSFLFLPSLLPQRLPSLQKISLEKSPGGREVPFLLRSAIQFSTDDRILIKSVPNVRTRTDILDLQN
jgi:hypothetical protein